MIPATLLKFDIQPVPSLPHVLVSREGEVYKRDKRNPSSCFAFAKAKSPRSNAYWVFARICAPARAARHTPLLSPSA